MYIYCWTEEDAKKIINEIWNDKDAWNRGERAWHTEIDYDELEGAFFSPNTSGDVFALIYVRL